VQIKNRERELLSDKGEEEEEVIKNHAKQPHGEHC
jgi:hypothetical protein